MRRLPLLLVFLAGCVSAQPTLPEDTGFDPFPIPDFTLTERSGDTISKADLEGKVWVASFVFTRCQGPCPRVSASMARAQKELADVEGIRLVTFTVDPNHDTPEVLRTYANSFGADPERWLFLTGDESQIQEIVQEGFKIHRMPQTDEREGHTIDHGTKLVLIDPKGQIVLYSDGFPRGSEDEQFEKEFGRLMKKARELANSRD